MYNRFLGILLLVVAPGCAAPVDRGAPPALPPDVTDPDVLLVVIDRETQQGRVHTFDAWANNHGENLLFTRGTCYTPWSWTLTRDGKEVATAPPTATCQPISWAEFPPGTNRTTQIGWNKTVWHPDAAASGEGRYVKAERGWYVASIAFSFYRSQDAERYCCPEQVQQRFPVWAG